MPRGRQTAAANSLPPLIAGVCLVDARGNVAASNEIARNWLTVGPAGKSAEPPLAAFLAEPLVAAALRRVFTGQDCVTLRANWPGDPLCPVPALAQLYRLDSSAGSQAAVIIQLAPLDVPPADALTGLPDRRALALSAEDWSHDLTRGGFALLFLDLDDFKRVNDQFGHAAGDFVLRELSARWLRCVREGDVVARYGGDEFVILLKNVNEPASAAPVLERLHDVTEIAIDLGDLPLRITCTIGAAFSPRDGASLDELIAAADRDMYARKLTSRPKKSL